MALAVPLEIEPLAPLASDDGLCNGFSTLRGGDGELRSPCSRLRGFGASFLLEEDAATPATVAPATAPIAAAVATSAADGSAGVVVIVGMASCGLGVRTLRGAGIGD